MAFRGEDLGVPRVRSSNPGKDVLRFPVKAILTLGAREVELVVPTPSHPIFGWSLVVRLLSVVNLTDGLRVREGALGVAERKFMS